ncbi:MAG: hypothetical protein VW124_19960 [Paracoccaceae bacterium]
MLYANTFIFLNEPGALSALGWFSAGKADSVSNFWGYNHYYLGYLTAVNGDEHAHWHLACCSVGPLKNILGIGVGEDIYSVSLRIMNWVKWQFAAMHCLVPV